MSSGGILRVATDVGGTFTDLVYLQKDEDGTQRIGTAKSDTTPPHFEQGVMDVLDQSGLDVSAIDFLAHGTTVIINALTERKGAKTALITTEGFRDILEIARGNRPDFFNLNYRKPKPFVPRYLRREVPGRISYKGEELKPLDLSGLPAILDDFRTEGVEAIAICFINSYANPVHEQAASARIKELWPEVAVVASYKITREWREYERTNTAVLSAYVQPVASRYLDRLIERLNRAGFNGSPYIMQSNCGVDTVDNARQVPITMVESGPASGVWGAAALGRIIGEENVIALDIGGTTAKCGLITNGQAKINTDYMIERTPTSAGYPIMVPVVDLVEIGNGGGSIAWVDEFGKLHVGPQSAGAVPGPVAYGKGGVEVTTTDANLALGRINPDYFCGGALVADMPGVNKALDGLAAKLGLERQEAARGVIRIANNNMVNALKLVSVNRGHDPRDFTLIAFGGGGGLHACALALELGIKKVIIPKQSAVFSAWGMLMTDIRRDYILTQIIELSSADPAGRLAAVLKQMEENALADFEKESIDRNKISFIRYGRFRYQNQEHTVEVELPQGEISPDLIKEIEENFHTDYEREYTYRLEAPVELVSFHLVAVAEVGRLNPQKIEPTGRSLAEAEKGRRQVDFTEAGIHEAVIYDGDLLEPGMKFTGPAVIEESGATTVVLPDMSCGVDEFGNIHIETV
ncbi:MAG: hydantoinase/oxoprolinase family protein [Deltaproteobacteria bacterium]|nr:hydantoinase/oxoprolinase family protein [Deltaproteobacteria bacterium]MBW2015303.1 hydantoinase/oxoprolinase family protein [Deltaproteobacteria bacterium]MBW2127836.1 hydantoinase/oxoprolinase family protein [Deltaproteobacteria bacterium]